MIGVQHLEVRLSGANSPHVWPLQILAEMGLVGVGIYILLVLLCVSDYRKAIRPLFLTLKNPKISSLVRGFFAATLTMSLAWTSGNPFNQLWFEFLLIGVVSLNIATMQSNALRSGIVR